MKREMKRRKRERKRARKRKIQKKKKRKNEAVDPAGVVAVGTSHGIYVQITAVQSKQRIAEVYYMYY